MYGACCQNELKLSTAFADRLGNYDDKLRIPRTGLLMLAVIKWWAEQVDDWQSEEFSARRLKTVGDLTLSSELIELAKERWRVDRNVSKLSRPASLIRHAISNRLSKNSRQYRSTKKKRVLRVTRDQKLSVVNSVTDGRTTSSSPTLDET